MTAGIESTVLSVYNSRELPCTVVDQLPRVACGTIYHIMQKLYTMIVIDINKQKFWDLH